MSRYRVVRDNNVPVDYGFDRPLSEFFAIHKGRGIASGPASKLRAALVKLKVWDKLPHEHQTAINLDLPF